MDGFVKILTNAICSSGFDTSHIYDKKRMELPGFFRPEKKWDLFVVKDNKLLAAIEVKSHIGPSFGNNFNNRTEEALGSSEDLWTAYREGAFNSSPQPWLGYLILLEDCAESKKPVSNKEPHFKVFKEFKDTSYAQRYELFCKKLVLERKYTSAAFIMSKADEGLNGQYSEPVENLNMLQFMRSLQAHIGAYAE